eukprot:g14094.t1
MPRVSKNLLLPKPAGAQTSGGSGDDKNTKQAKPHKKTQAASKLKLSKEQDNKKRKGETAEVESNGKHQSAPSKRPKTVDLKKKCKVSKEDEKAFEAFCEKHLEGIKDHIESEGKEVNESVVNECLKQLWEARQDEKEASQSDAEDSEDEIFANPPMKKAKVRPSKPPAKPHVNGASLRNPNPDDYQKSVLWMARILDLFFEFMETKMETNNCMQPVEAHPKTAKPRSEASDAEKKKKKKMKKVTPMRLFLADEEWKKKAKELQKQAGEEKKLTLRQAQEQLWKDLPTEEREAIEKKCPPKKALCAWMLFCEDNRTRVTASIPNEFKGKHMTQATKLLSEEWKALPEEKKESYLAKAKQAKEEYDAAKVLWDKKQNGAPEDDADGHKSEENEAEGDEDGDGDEQTQDAEPEGNNDDEEATEASNDENDGEEMEDVSPSA